MSAIHDDPLYLLVANPTAQSGRAQRWIDEAMRAMRERGMRAELMHTEPEGRTVAAVTDRLAAGDVGVVIYLGGDGTFHEVAIGLLAAHELSADDRAPLGMLPSGTANDQGLSFGINRGEIARNISIIAEGHITKLDVGLIERLDHDGTVIIESYFFDSVGWGMNPDILATRNRYREMVGRVPVLRDVFRDKMIYFSASMGKLFESYFEPVKFSAEITADGVRHELDGMTDVIISGTPIYAGHWVLDRNAEPDDGIFELAPMQGRRDWASKALRDLAASPIWQEQLDHLGLTHSRGFAASSFELDFYRLAKAELHAQVDGEEWGTGDKYRVTVLPRMLPIITPADFVPPWRPTR
jgi:diacylglycerol kinase family enzyme